MNMRTTRRLAAASMAAAAAARHRRLHRPRIGLRLPPDPRGADRRNPRQLPRTPSGGHRLVPRAHGQCRAARSHRGPSRTHCRRAARSVDRRHRHRRSHRPGHRAVPMGTARSQASATTPRCPPRRPMPIAPSNCCTPGSARCSARPSATPSRPRSPSSWSSRITRIIAPRWMTFIGYAVGRADRHRGHRAPRHRRSQHHQLRRLHRVVPVAHRHGRRPVALASHRPGDNEPDGPGLGPGRANRPLTHGDHATASAALVGVLGREGLPALTDQEYHHTQRRQWVGPPPPEHRVQHQAAQHHDRQVHAR